ncbi:hypothetical protein EBI01_19125 [Marinomonas rhizomae]|uniref:Capsular polysaccharide biosynthesis protein n=1 Tax=Marinomonas rhizomae TaxID=491948 RepID=A0A366J8G3_9GAMM|nr:hypothetical protein [Marinomonas rhizomae]RBP83243.1 capsular polysaccharide biosynthesis protein [Marinomonas rhizomae]RNF69415.1 hypothetical protein EBI01_19125 [Marinomonas rhizomae]
MRLEKLLFDKKVVVLIDDFERYLFFRDVLGKCRTKNVVFLHATLYSFLYAKKDIKLNELSENILLRGESSPFISMLSIDEVKLGFRIGKKIRNRGLDSVFSDYDHILIFKGFQYAFYRLKEFLTEDKAVFFEIANFPKKFQWSVTGVNADSDHTLRVSEVNEKITDEKVESLRNLLFSYIPPHVSKKVSSKALESLLNKFGHILFKTIYPEPSFLAYAKVALYALISKRIIKKIVKKSRNNITENYCLFIAQVEHDSQTVFQSQEVGVSALKKAKKISEERNIKLIVRLHPAEKNLNNLLQTINYCNLNGIEINNAGSLLNVVKDSEFVMTINSTGGAHSILFDKEVINFGDAFYQGWTKYDVVKYYNYVLENSIY